MAFDWDFLPSLSHVKQLKRSASALTLASISNLRRESMASQSSATSSALYDTIQEENSWIEESFVEKKKKVYVQQGMRNMKILQAYLAGEIQVPDELLLTWLPGYIPKIEKVVN